MKNTFEQIKQSEARLRKIIDAIPALVWCGLPDGSKEFFNQRWRDYTGLSPEEARGWGWKVTIHPDDLAKLEDSWFKFVASGEPGAVETRIRRFDGEYRWFLFRAEPLRDEHGNVVNWCGTNTDCVGHRSNWKCARDRRTDSIAGVSSSTTRSGMNRGKSFAGMRRAPISMIVDVRLLAATHRDLKAAVAEGTFREDLFYRLNVFPISVPALRERADDIPLLVEYLVGRAAKRAGKKIRQVKQTTMDLFKAYSWPGNIRELQNVVERAVILCEGDTLCVDESWFKYDPPRPGSAPETFTESLADREREMIEAALRESRGRISGPFGAAKKLGIPRQTLDSKIAALGIDKSRFKA